MITDTIRALGLCSGGLDSILSAIVLRQQGIEVEWISFETPFFSSQKAKAASRMTGIPLTVRNITPVYLEMLKHPRCGYGKHFNPCMDCHALMFRLAGEVMKEGGFQFMFSGEVLGQRPMSQTLSSLRYVEKHSGYDGYILRPLSAKKLPPTIPEIQGWVNRDQLMDFSGRSRKPQIELARQFGIHEYPSPAGGCLLTESVYSARLKDLFRHQDIQTETDLHLLKYGRHFRIDALTKIVVGRTLSDNEHLLRYYRESEHTLIKVRDYPGPTVLMIGDTHPSKRLLAAAIAVRFSKAPKDALSDVMVKTPAAQEVLVAGAMSDEQIQSYAITG